jgi:hypothetical protein
MEWVVMRRPGCFTPGNDSIYCAGQWVCPRAGLDGCGITSPTEFDPRTFQPVDSRYTDYAIL